MMRTNYVSSLLLLVMLIGGACSGPRQIPIAGAGPMPTLTEVGHVGGVTTAIAVEDDYAYLGFSHEFVVLDITDRTQPRQVAALPIPASDIALVAQTAYVVGRTGLHIVDITVPTAPRLLGQWQATATLSDVAVAAGYAYVVSYSDFYVVAVDNPLQPQLVGHANFSARFEGLTAANGYIYATSSIGFQVIDVADPTAPTEIYRFETDVVPSGSAFIHDDAYFGSDNLLQRVDLTSPRAPELVTPLSITGWVADVVVTEGIAYLANGYRGLQVWDLTDWSAPVQIGVYGTQGTAITLAVAEGYVYLLDCDEGLRIFDAADPTQLTEVGAFTPLGVTYGLAANGSSAYVASGFNGGLHVVDVTTSTDRHTITTHLAGSNVYGFDLQAGYLYLIKGSTLQILDLATTPEPSTVGSYSLEGQNSIRIWGDYAYLSDDKGNVLVLDVANPAEPVTVAEYSRLGHVAAMAFDDKYVYLSKNDRHGLHILARAESGELTRIGLYPTADKLNQIAVIDGHVYLAMANSGLHVVDVTSPTTPRLLGANPTQDEVFDIAVEGDYAFVAVGNAGLQVFDITHPAAPVSVAMHATLDCAHRVITADGLIYVADRFGGLFIFALGENE